MRKINSFRVAPYVLVDVINALTNSGVVIIYVTKEDNELVVSYDIDLQTKINYDDGDANANNICEKGDNLGNN